MNYDEAIEYVHSIPWMGKGLGLKRIGALLLAVGNPENELKFIHVAGTNGKGSICEMTARILESAGYKTGFFVSPYIHRFNERMQINHRPISDDELAELVGLLKPVAEKMEDPPSEFEVITAAAFLYFKKNKCDYVVLEVGMGGRLDATNVIGTPLAAVIATIGLDHTKHLGNTVGEIAYEKAGIIKPAGDVVVYGQGGEAAQVFRRVSDERGASLRFSDFTLIEALGEDDEFQYFKYKSGGSYSLSLHGEHQLKNAATVLELVALLREKGVALSEKAVADGLAGARWPGRFETLCKDPLFIVDGGHNPEGALAAVAAFKRRYPGMRAVVLLGMTASKAVDEVIRIVDEIAVRYVVIEADTSRAMPKEQLFEEVQKLGKQVETAKSVSAGVSRALELTKPAEASLAIGSLYTIAQIREYFGKE